MVAIGGRFVVEGHRQHGNQTHQWPEKGGLWDEDGQEEWHEIGHVGLGERQWSWKESRKVFLEPRQGHQ